MQIRMFLGSVAYFYIRWGLNHDSVLKDGLDPNTDCKCRIVFVFVSTTHGQVFSILKYCLFLCLVQYLFTMLLLTLLSTVSLVILHFNALSSIFDTMICTFLYAALLL